MTVRNLRSPAPVTESLVSAARHFDARRFADAERDARAALVAAPNDPGALNILASVAMESGRPKEAVPFFRRALAKDPENHFILFNLGETYCRMASYTQALTCFEKAVRLQPNFAAARTKVGDMLRAALRNNEAEREYLTALRQTDAPPGARYGLALLLMQRAEPGQAIEHLRSALDACPSGHPMRPDILAALGRALLQLDDGLGGLTTLLHAVDAEPDNADRNRLLAGSLRDCCVVPTDPGFRTTLIRLFCRDDVNPRHLATAAAAVFRQDDDFAALLAAIEASPGDAGSLIASYPETVSRFASDDLLLALLSAAPIADAAIELLVVALRSDLLRRHTKQAGDRHVDLKLAVALAHQGFLNEYAHWISGDDNAGLDRLVNTLNRTTLTGLAEEATSIALVAAFRPLQCLPFAANLLAARTAGLESLIRQQFDEPATEQQLRLSLRVRKPTTDATSLAVKQQYEENPYPRWTRCAVATPVPLRRALLDALPHCVDLAFPARATLRVLVAGCGTGLEIMRVAHRYADTKIIAVDLSGASLAYAARKVRDYGLTNVELLQADILDLAGFSPMFDLIESFGVLHHMADPEAGLKILASLMSQNGLISIGLYSELGRRAVVAARTYIAASEHTSDERGIRELRRALLIDRPPEVEPVMSPASDFWTASDCRDLILHVNEHRFSLIEVERMLDRAGLAFLGVEFGNEADRTRFCAREGGVEALQDIEALHNFERDFPDTFGDTYRIWAQRKPAVRR